MDFDYGDCDDDESFKSAIGSPLAESFTVYSHSVAANHPPVSLQIDVSSDNDSEFEDALSEYYIECDDDSLESGHADEPGDRIDEDLDGNNRPPPGSEEDTTLTLPATTTNESINYAHPETKAKSIVPISSDSDRRPVIRSLTFNQDRDCIAIATSTGFQISTIDDHNGKRNVHKLDIRGGTNCIQILHRTSLLAIVKSRTPRIVTLIHARNGRVVKELSFTSAVRRVEMNKLCMVVLTASGELHVFTYKRTMESDAHLEFLIKIDILHDSESARTMTAEGALVQGAYFDLTSHLTDGCAWLVAKSKDGVGVVSVYKIACEGNTALSTIELVESFTAHNNGISRIAIGGVVNEKGNSSDSEQRSGLHFATASSKGTIVRVYSLPVCDKLYELQRGSSSCIIHSMAFNANATILSVSGSKGTIHLFRLNEENLIQNALSNDGSRKVRIAGLMKRLTTKSSNDEQIVRSFARLRLKGQHSRKSNTITMLDELQNAEVEDNVVICLSDGTLLQYAVRENGKKRPIRADDILFQIDLK